MKKTPTIKDVAKLSNASPATVSRALQQPHLVKKDTIKRINKAIKKLNYQVNVTAQALRSRKTYTILVVVPNIKNPFFSHIFDGIHQYAEQQNYTVFLANTNGDEAQEQIYINQLIRGRVDGIILLNGSIPSSLHLQVDLSKMPIVFACESPDDSLAHTPLISINNIKAAKELVDLLIDQGHKKIAYVNGPEDNSLAKDRYFGYQTSLQSADIDLNDKFFYQGNYKLETGVDAAQYFLSLKERPTAIFCANDEMAIGLIYELQKNGVNIPHDISVAGFDDIDFASTIRPALTTVNQNAKTIGYKATEALFERMKNPLIPAENLSFEVSYEIIERESTHKI